MKKSVLFVTGLLAFNVLSAQKLEIIKLKEPNMNRGSSAMNALENRRSTDEYSDRMLNIDDLSDLLWAANGINRPESGKRTAASAMNRQDVSVYTFTTEGVHLYDAAKHELLPVISGDHRKLFGERGMSPLIILLVTDISKFGDVGTNEDRREWGAIDLGLVSQNMAIFCAANGIGTRPRAGMDREGIASLLKLSDTQLPMLNHSVGYPKLSIDVDE
ncbi:nitroreductase family protein [Proteiniphilum sp.]|uniref:nitroreductase family protein n=1 Tax=Proteiniphilum sp. TaxID=1926877 RepID=UPI0033179AEC